MLKGRLGLETARISSRRPIRAPLALAWRSDGTRRDALLRAGSARGGERSAGAGTLRDSVSGRLHDSSRSRIDRQSRRAASARQTRYCAGCRRRRWRALLHRAAVDRRPFGTCATTGQSLGGRRRSPAGGAAHVRLAHGRGTASSGYRGLAWHRRRQDERDLPLDGDADRRRMARTPLRPHAADGERPAEPGAESRGERG